MLKIGDVCTVGDGAHASIKRHEYGVLYLSSRNFKDGGLDLSKVYYISEDDFQKHFRENSKAITKPRAGDVVLSIIGTIGEPYVVKPTDRFGLSSAVAILRSDTEQVLPEYLFYWIRGKEFQDAVFSVKGGVAQGYVSLEMIRSLPVRSLPIPKQAEIVDILSSYDNLIENNNRRIAILEEMAQSLYREWFVKFRFPGHENAKFSDSPLGKIPEGWEVMAASAAIQINPRTKLPKEGKKPFVPMSGLNESSMVVGDIEYKSGNSGAKFINDDTLFSRITPCLQNGKIGYVQFLGEAQPVGFGSTEFIVLRATERVCPEYVYLLSRTNEFRENAIKSMTGATGRQRVSNSCFDSYMLAAPEIETMERFHSVVKGMFEEIFNLSKRNRNLRKQRDLLIPKLIGGNVAI